MSDMNAINHYLQNRLQDESISETTAVEAAQWLDQAGLLRGRKDRRGAPLRDLLRKGQISGQHQEANRRWYIRSCR